MVNRPDPYTAQIRDEQKAILNGLLGIIYDNYDTTRRMQSTVDSVYRMVVVVMVVVLLAAVVGIVFACWWGCRRDGQRPRLMYQMERSTASPLHQPRKSAPIEL